MWFTPPLPTFFHLLFKLDPPSKKKEQTVEATEVGMWTVLYESATASQLNPDLLMFVLKHFLLFTTMEMYFISTCPCWKIVLMFEGKSYWPQTF